MTPPLMGIVRSLLWTCMGALSLCIWNTGAWAGSRFALDLPWELSIDIHSHLFMEDGVGFLFRGEFEGPLQASDWTNQLSSMANPETLEQSRLGIVGVALYAHPIFEADLKDAIRRQIDKAEEFVRTHPLWVIARSPDEAHQALQAGKRVLILTLEGASDILETDEDIREFIDERGIRIVTLLHLTDDHFGGVSFLQKAKGWVSNPLATLDQIFNPHHDEHGVRTNRRGLSPLGLELAQKLIAKNVWIDLSHASDESTQTLAALLESHHQPLLMTHSVMRRFGPYERNLSDSMIDRIATSRGIVGLGPNTSLLADTPILPGYCPRGCSPKDCEGTVSAFAVQFDLLAARLGATSIVLGSDFNGGMDHLKPSCRTGTTLDGEAGLWNVGQTRDLWSAARTTGATAVPNTLNSTLENFLNTWARVKP